MTSRIKVDIPKDNNSLFASIGWYTKESHEVVRHNIVTEISTYKDEYIDFLNENISFEEYITKMSNVNVQGDNTTLIAAAQYYQLNINVNNDIVILVKDDETPDLFLFKENNYYYVETPIVTVFDDPKNFNVKHPLNTEWSLWTSVKTDTNKKVENWMDTVKNIITVNSIEDFWGVFNNIPKASELNYPFDYYFFRKDIQPMWEDPANIHGGKMTLMFKKTCDAEFIDKVWLYTVLGCIGEQFEDNICGIALNIRKHQDRINVWINTDKEENIKKLGLQWKELIEVKNMHVSYIKHDNKDINYLI
jgi:translation initiation factor 4E